MLKIVQHQNMKLLFCRFSVTILSLWLVVFLLLAFISLGKNNIALAENNLVAPPNNNEYNGRVFANKALQDIQQNMALSKERTAQLLREVDDLKKDQTTLTQAVLESAKIERHLMEAIYSGKERLADLLSEKLGVEKQLAKQRVEFMEVLAAVERLGLKPPPAILVHPDDALQAIRSATLLSAIVPNMNERLDALNKTVRRFEALQVSIQNETRQLEKSVNEQVGERERLQLLLAQKAKLQKKSEENLNNERLLAVKLAQRAQSVQDLVAELDRQNALQSPKNNEAGQDQETMLDVRADFNKLKGRLLLPIIGKKLIAFGNNTQGETYEGDAGAVVLSPAGGIVRYAGDFRSYGQMLIIDVGQNYHIILAKLGTLSVEQGQVVLQGEPVGFMDRQLIVSADSLDIGKSAPMLYIEIRKEGKPVDPQSWWVKGQMGKGQG